MSFSALLEGKLGDVAVPTRGPRFANAEWLDGPLVMGRLDALAELRNLRKTLRPALPAQMEIRVARLWVVEVKMVRSSGVPEVDAALRRVYEGAEAPFYRDGWLDVKLEQA